MPIVNNSNWNMFMFLRGEMVLVIHIQGKPINADGDTMNAFDERTIHLLIEFETPTCDKPHHTITRCLSPQSIEFTFTFASTQRPFGIAQCHFEIQKETVNAANSIPSTCELVNGINGNHWKRYSQLLNDFPLWPGPPTRTRRPSSIFRT